MICSFSVCVYISLFGAHYVAQASLKVTILLLYTHSLHVLGFQMCTTMPGFVPVLNRSLFHHEMFPHWKDALLDKVVYFQRGGQCPLEWKSSVPSLASSWF